MPSATAPRNKKVTSRQMISKPRVFEGRLMTSKVAGLERRKPVIAGFEESV